MVRGQLPSIFAPAAALDLAVVASRTARREWEAVVEAGVAAAVEVDRVGAAWEGLAEAGRAAAE